MCEEARVRVPLCATVFGEAEARLGEDASVYSPHRNESLGYPLCVNPTRLVDPRRWSGLYTFASCLCGSYEQPLFLIG